MKPKLTHALSCIGNLERKWSTQLTNQCSHPSYFPKKKILNQTYADSAYFHLSDVDGRGFIDSGAPPAREARAWAEPHR